MLQDRAGELLLRLGYTLATAESLTGGLVGAHITSVPGSSAYYLGGVISYATDIKNSLLGVSDDVLSSKGAVSEESAAAMAMGVKKLFGATVSLSTTGVAGPATQEGQPVGTLFVSVSDPSGMYTEEFHGEASDREEVREWAAGQALSLLVQRLEDMAARSNSY
jgi:nicotinamide-nucleotide amidase